MLCQGLRSLGELDAEEVRERKRKKRQSVNVKPIRGPTISDEVDLVTILNIPAYTYCDRKMAARTHLSGKVMCIDL